MKILYFRKENQLFPGIVTEQGILDIITYLETSGENWQPSNPLTIEDVEKIQQLITHSPPTKTFLREKDLVIAPAIPYPSKIICIGLNYRRHAEESGMALPTTPVAFTKYNNTLIDYGHNVTLGSVGKEFDYEVELGVVIGKKTKNVNRSEALDHVLGYVVANDLSCRDLQFLSSQWLLGKSLDGFLPLGKYLVTADEIKNPQQLALTCTLNGELRQQSNTADMIFPVDEIVSFLSKHMTLEAGDLILTGTPEGVIMGQKEKVWLKQGDEVKVEIEHLGFTINKMV